MVSNSQMTDAIKLSPQFEAENPGIHLKFVTLPENQARAKITMSTATGGDTFDVVMISNYENTAVGGEPGVCLDDLDVRQPLFGHQLPRHGDVDRVDLESYDAAPRADALGEQLEDSTRAASDVDRALSLSGADSVQ
jgi:hypothetical protein